MDAFRLRATHVDAVNGMSYFKDTPVGLWDQLSPLAQKACRTVARERLRRDLMEHGLILTDIQTAAAEVTVWRYEDGDLTAAPERVA